jgi:hypothetical protein
MLLSWRLANTPAFLHEVVVAVVVPVGREVAFAKTAIGRPHAEFSGSEPSSLA